MPDWVPELTPFTIALISAAIWGIAELRIGPRIRKNLHPAFGGTSETVAAVLGGLIAYEIMGRVVSNTDWWLVVPVAAGGSHLALAFVTWLRAPADAYVLVHGEAMDPRDEYEKNVMGRKPPFAWPYEVVTRKGGSVTWEFETPAKDDNQTDIVWAVVLFDRGFRPFGPNLKEKFGKLKDMGNDMLTARIKIPNATKTGSGQYSLELRAKDKITVLTALDPGMRIPK